VREENCTSGGALTFSEGDKIGLEITSVNATQIKTGYKWTNGYPRIEVSAA
jgi:hypothetical protein